MLKELLERIKYYENQKHYCQDWVEEAKEAMEEGNIYRVKEMLHNLDWQFCN